VPEHKEVSNVCAVVRVGEKNSVTGTDYVVAALPS
jgi:hypothetical protein